MELKLAFWNAYNLFEVGAKERGPQTAQELSDKLDRLSEVAMGWFGDTGPDIIAFCEVHNERLAGEFAKRVFGPNFGLIFERQGFPPSADIGIGIAFNPLNVSLTKLNAERPTTKSRPKALVIRAVVGNQVFRIAVIHWASRMQGESAEIQRVASARWLASEMTQSEASGEGLIAFGDFNAEPMETVFQLPELSVSPTHRPLLKSAGPVYGATWRFLFEAGFAENRGESYQAPRALGSFWEGRSSGLAKNSQAGTFALFDHIIVTRSLLRGPGPRLIEKDLGYSISPVHAEKEKHGEWVPIPWSYQNNVGTGASDHLPVLAKIRVS